MWPMQSFFYFLMITGIFIIFSFNNWLGIWIGLELNMFGFLPLLGGLNNEENLEASMKYFLIQAFGSGLFLCGSLLMFNSKTLWNMMSLESTSYLIYLFIFMGISLKLGLAPFYMWLPSIMSSISWFNCIILNTIQKMGPIALFYKLFSLNWMILMMLAFTALIGGIGGLSQSLIRALMAYSSLVHMGWFLCLSMLDMYLMWMYIIIYFLLSSFIFSYCNWNFLKSINLNHKKSILLSLSLLSLGGVPPMTGFYMKWIALTTFMKFDMFFLCLMLLLASFLSLYYYLNLMFSSVGFLNHFTMKYNNWDKLLIFSSSTGLIFMK
uniref:NADH-ubiquinone oxidoreductase chain 2 n=1 Tax=Scutopus ventrolineatus TaxID=52922 RepID=A0A096XEC4_SCUVE|nr:NADH dehydrogenase subunit 2 [Scutopus ventrolineatus]AHI45705.1 NADH dehydrogenase subunit 2 [Scutopus ventrolineatus]